MKKIAAKLLLALVICAVVAGALAFVFLDRIVQRGVETVGPAVTKVNVRLGSAGISVLSGKGELKGLEVGNPEGFSTSDAIKVGSIAVEVVPASVLSEKVVVKSVRVEGPEINFEAGPGGSNLGKILGNVRGEAPSQPANTPAGRKLQVDDIVITGGKVRMSTSLLAGQAAVAPLPEIRLSQLGQGPEGITAAELTEKILTQVVEAAMRAAPGMAGELGKGLDAARNAGGAAAEQAEKAAKGLGDLLKRK